jgi:3-methyladenine DNA glycosylase/8-oxoguanine DNA glycosylase
VWRRVQQPMSGELSIQGSARADGDDVWVRDTLNPTGIVVDWDDSMLLEIAARYPGLAPYCDGSLFDGLVTSIVGQSISVASAAMTQARLARLFGDEIRIGGRAFAPLPSAGMLADASVELIRASGVTTRRAAALKQIAEMAAAGELPGDDLARSQPNAVVGELLSLPQVGPWTAVSALLWGVGAPDAWPTGDVAVLRALRHAYAGDEVSLKIMDSFAERWHPHRGIAARLLWTNLFGTDRI